MIEEHTPEAILPTEERILKCKQALAHLNSALELLDAAQMNAAGAHVDLAIHRLADSLSALS